MRESRLSGEGHHRPGAAAGTTRIAELARLLDQQDASKPAPVETWDPPYRGDIGMAISADGTWTYRGSPIERPALVRLFARVLRRDEDGRHYLVTPAERVDVSVADAPFLAVEMEVRGTGENQTVIFRTNVDDVVICGGDHPLHFAIEPGTDGVKPYVRIRGRLEALVTRAVTLDLLELLTERDDGTSGIWSGGSFHELAQPA